ncbi:DHA2 family efflux MFS transporter permease subunit [Amycolatopsis sp. NPDC058986]|uniref:DHA2 family efflux MFS transporter permease subunit n=1 Tax=unclassified Amycolatopsis TaxID=2618356 RepID=UPI00366EB67C
MSSQAGPAAPAAEDKLDRDVLKVAVVVVAGAIMAILDVTVVNVAMQKLMIQFSTSFDTIQWIATGYMLALATVIPITGWAADRFGTKRLYLLAIAFFLIGSMLAGLAWNVESLIIFRVVQGFGGGMLMPAGMTMLTRAAGPQRIGRVMSVISVPMLLGPVCGPILGGWLVDAVSWRWIFYINVPIGAVAILLSLKLLPKDSPEPSQRFDFPGLLMVSPGLAALIFGVSRIPEAGGVTNVAVWLPGLAGLVLLVAFALRSMRIANPLLDMGLFRNKAFSMSMLTMAVFFIGMMGSMLLLPTYLQVVRGESALQSGLLIAPQALGVMITMPRAGKLADKMGPRKLVLPGVAVMVLGMVPFTMVTATTSFLVLLPALFVVGLGMGLTMVPVMSAALQQLELKDMAKASTATNILQQTAGAVGSAVMSIILAALLAGKFGVPTSQGQVAATIATQNPATHDAAASMASDAFATTFVWALVLMAASIVPAFFLPRKAPAAPSAPAGSGAGEEAAPPVVVH